MAVFSIEIADEDVNRVLGAVAHNYKRPDQVPNPNFDPDQEVGEDNPENIDNPETVRRSQFVNRIVREFLADHVNAYDALNRQEQQLLKLQEMLPLQVFLIRPCNMLGHDAINEMPHSSSSEMINRSNGEIITLVLSTQNTVDVTLSIQK